MENILVIGSSGQLGSELLVALRKKYGKDHVIASDIKPGENPSSSEEIFEICNVLDVKQIRSLLKKYQVTQVYLLAAILSATGEKNPKLAWELNMDGLLNILELAREKLIKKVFWPSSIAVFGPGTPRELTPQETIMNPNTVYGISKLAGERWCEYYFKKHHVDVRSIRFPGLIGYKSQPGGGTTDYAVDIFFKAVKDGKFTCFLTENTLLPMMYMPDAVKASIDLMEAASEDIKVRSSYNVAAFSTSPSELSKAIKKHLSDFTISYQPDYRQEIADSWPDSIDDSHAKKDWGWSPDYSVETMTEDILSNLMVSR